MEVNTIIKLREMFYEDVNWVGQAIRSGIVVGLFEHSNER
jgi:hypothetical protein